MELQEILAHGKSIVCEEILKITNSKLIDADKIAKSLDYEGSQYLQEIKEVFGEKILNERKTLNRKLLADIIYHDKIKKSELDKITFKYIDKAIDEELKIIFKYIEENGKELKNIEKKPEKELELKYFDYILIDAPLLFEAEINKKCDFVISIIAKDEIKIDRICKRDNISVEIAKSRLEVQNKDEFFKNNSDFIIENNGDIKDIKYKIERILNIIS